MRKEDDMCGLAGLILGRRRRTRRMIGHLGDQFKKLLVESEARGTDASGAAVIRADGLVHVYKRPMPAGELVREVGFRNLMSLVDGDTTAVLGHARFATVGSEENNLNNHPIEAGSVIGTHNGTIINADRLFQVWRLPRSAQVDSEVFFRVAENAIDDFKIDLGRLKRRLRVFKGSMTAVFTTIYDPEKIIVAKGDKPLFARINHELDAVFYASSKAFLNRVLGMGRGWLDLKLPSMTIATFDVNRLQEYRLDDFNFERSYGVKTFHIWDA